MPDASPGGAPEPARDAANLTGLLSDYGAIWEITKTTRGYTAQRRSHPVPRTVFTAETVPALRDLLHHGYDTAKLAVLLREVGGMWDIEHLDPGSAWLAISRDHPAQIVTAADLDSLDNRLRCTPAGGPGDDRH